MTKTEVLHFMKKIKSYYQNFAIEDYILDEWYDRLKPYNIEDVYKKLDEHLTGKYQNDIPKLHFITRYLKTPKEKYQEQNIIVRCSVCNELVELQRHDRHLARHNSIFYIKKNEHRIGKTFDETKMQDLTEVEFDRLYKKFLEELYVVSTNEPEKERIEKVIFVR